MSLVAAILAPVSSSDAFEVFVDPIENLLPAPDVFLFSVFHSQYGLVPTKMLALFFTFTPCMSVRTALESDHKPFSKLKSFEFDSNAAILGNYPRTDDDSEQRPSG
ncbi:hypothetical protein B0H11DRAFT_1937670 [Mycena galericulata]|nr:hypothetical protein B0H11DRAFT_1937670 [Mycena galericulata]